jgi:hypothetical protein
LSYFTDPLGRRSLAKTVQIFAQLGDRNIALYNQQKLQTRTVPFQEFAESVQRLAFVCHFIYLNHRKLSGPAVTQLSNTLRSLMPKANIELPGTLQRICQDVSCLYDETTAFKIQDFFPPPLTEELLRIPPPQIDITEMPRTNEDIYYLPDLYDAIMKNPEPPPKGWWRKLSQLMQPITSFFRPASEERKSLERMRDKIRAHKDNVVLGTAKQFIEGIMAICRDPQRPLEERQNALREIVIASGYCDNEWGMEGERRWRELTRKKTTLNDQFLNWKAQFIEQSLVEFLGTILTPEEHRQNTHFLAGIYFKWGAQLGHAKIQTPKMRNAPDSHSVDCYRVDVGRRGYNPAWERLTWEQLFAFLQERWRLKITDSIAIQSDKDKCQGGIGEMLDKTVAAKLPAAGDSSDFVIAEYYNGNKLNSRGINRFLRETAASVLAVR